MWRNETNPCHHKKVPQLIKPVRGLFYGFTLNNDVNKWRNDFFTWKNGHSIGKNHLKLGIVHFVLWMDQFFTPRSRSFIVRNQPFILRHGYLFRFFDCSDEFNFDKVLFENLINVLLFSYLTIMCLIFFLFQVYVI